MAETETWTPADDEFLRRSLDSLKADVDPLPLADVRFVKARGSARRRRAMLGWTVGAAAAAIVAVVVGFTTLGGQDTTQPVPPARTTTVPTTAPTTPVDREAVSPYLSQPSTLPLSAEWKLALQWTSAFDITKLDATASDLCFASAPAPSNQESVLSRTGNIQGAQILWTLATDQAAATLADSMARSIGACRQGDFAVKGVQTSAWPRLYSYTAGGAGSGWYAVARSGSSLAVLNVVEPDHSTTEFTRAQVERLATIATERLARYASGRPGTAGPTTTTATEPMPVTGSQPLVSSTLFVPASQWASKALTTGQRTYAGPGDPEGSASVVQCETDQLQASIGGRYGIVSIRAGSGDANYIGKQRVRLDDSTSTTQRQAFVDARLSEAATLYGKGCSLPNGTVKATPGPVDGTWRLDTVFRDGSPTFSEWVGVTAQHTPGAMTTVVLTKVADPSGAFTELERLLALARQL